MSIRIGFVFAVIILAIPFVTAQNQPSGSQKRQNEQQANPTAPVSVNCNCSTQTQESKDKSQGWKNFVAWPEGVATWALIATLGAIIWQAVEVRRSVNAAKESADALISAERPWLGTRVEKSANIQQEFSFTNLGRTPALIIGVSTMRMITNDLPEVPEYMPEVDDAARLLDESGNMYLLAPNDTWYFKTIDFVSHGQRGQFSRNELDDIAMGERRLFFYGKVRYRDVFTLKNTHETHFCYLYKGNEFRLFGQKGYNKYT